MPKISSNNSVRIQVDNNTKHFGVDVHYNKDFWFYARIPDELLEPLKHVSEPKEYHVAYSTKSGKVVTGNTESECLDRVKTLFKALLNSQITHRNVIILFVDGPGRLRGAYESNYNDKHQKIELNVAMVYAEESVVLGGQPNYNKVTHHYFGSEKQVRKSSISIGRSRCVVIDDTSENRDFLESLYGKLSQLNETLQNFTKDNESLLGLISSNQRLLG